MSDDTSSYIHLANEAGEKAAKSVHDDRDIEWGELEIEAACDMFRDELERLIECDREDGNG